MRHHQVVLELREFPRRNRDIVKAAEAGGDAVNRAADVFHLAVQILAAFYYGFFRLL